MSNVVSAPLQITAVEDWFDGDDSTDSDTIISSDFTERFQVSKVITHSQGLSTTFRQWRANHSHCRFLHGYALQVKIDMSARRLDDRNWVFDFGGFKPLKEKIFAFFDHHTMVAVDDPALEEFKKLHEQGLIQLTIVPAVGCEAFARIIYEWVQEMLTEAEVMHHVTSHQVTVSEHEGNSATYGESE